MRRTICFSMKKKIIIILKRASEKTEEKTKLYDSERIQIDISKKVSFFFFINVEFRLGFFRSYNKTTLEFIGVNRPFFFL